MRTRTAVADRARSDASRGRGGRVALLAVIALLASVLVPSPASAAPHVESGVAPAAAASALTGFDRENIISDALFYNGAAMTQAQIQTFLDQKIGSCRNDKCINVLKASFSSRDEFISSATGNEVCKAIHGGTMLVSEIIYRAQVACGISAKVILVTLQKEQGLVLSTAPSDWNLRAAMGASCPDTAPCDPLFAGIGPQILKGTQQLKIYKAGSFAKQPGLHHIGYHPNAACGGTTINIRNYATAALYNYTPYQPNAAALAAGSGLGDECSSYGNRNFYRFYTEWFGATQAGAAACASAEVTAAGGEFTTTAELNLRSGPSTTCESLALLSSGTVVTRTGVQGAWARVRANGIEAWVHGDYLTAAPEPTYAVDRLSGPSRYETAVEVTRRSHPSGAATVFLASGQDFSDALTGSAIAAGEAAAALLTSAETLPEAVRSELARLNPARVVLVGGTGSLSPALESDVRDTVPSAAVERVAGADRYQTSLRLAERRAGAATAYIASGRTYPDALSASAVAGSQSAPVVLVDGTAAAASADALGVLSSLGVQRVVIVGGPATVSTSIEDGLRERGLQVERKYGADRYATTYAVNADAYPTSAPTAYLAAGTDFPDALSGAVLAGAQHAPLFLQPAACMTGRVKDYLMSRGTRSVTLVGGSGSLGDAVLSSVRC
ncbi:cell wall-binding repeat-containing protein [Microbacterium lacticum]